MWGNFIVKSNPSIPSEIAASKWPGWLAGTRERMLNLNETGGTPYVVQTQSGVNITQYRGEGLRNKFDVVDAFAWEGDRGERCEFWKGIARKIPI
jgi:hypothetical protein